MTHAATREARPAGYRSARKRVMRSGEQILRPRTEEQLRPYLMTLVALHRSRGSKGWRRHVRNTKAARP